MPSYNSTHTGAQHDRYVTNTELINLIYPVGAVYISTVATNPGTLFGVGTWTQIQDRFLLCAGSTYAAGGTGGAASHTHTTNAGTSGGTAITIAQMPSHNHGSSGGHTHTVQRSGFGNLNLSGGTVKAGGTITNWGNENTTGWNGSVVTNNTGSHTHDSQGSGQAHTHSQVSVGTSSGSNLPPYIAVYVWQRTA